MRLATTLIPALHALRVHRLRTGLALLGICFGVAAVILIVAWGSIGRAKLEAEISELGADMLVVLPGAARSEGAWWATGSLRTVTEADAEAIAREAFGIAASAPLLRGSVQVVYGNHNQATTLRGVTPAWFAARPWPVTMGRPLDDEDVRRSAKVALLAHGVARILFGEDDPSGKTVRINQVPFTVIGVLEEIGHSLGGVDLDDQVIVPLTTARKRILGFLAGHPTAVGGRMAIGARRREIGLQFLIEAGLLALLGSGAGVVLALGAAVAFGAGSAIRNPTTGVAILVAVAAATLITLISALYPARKAARLSPADALAQDPGTYSQDWPKRMIRAVAASTAARAAARIFQVIESTKDQTAKALRETGSVSASKRSPRESPLEQHAAWLLGLIAEEPDLTLQDVQMLLLREKALSVGLGSVWRFYDRHGIRFRKKPARRRGPSQGARAATAGALA